MKMIPVLGLFCVALSVAGCGGADRKSKSPEKPLLVPMHETGAAPPIESVEMPITQLERADVVEAVNAGLGRFLGGFVTEASLSEEGKFQGFRLVEVRDKSKFRGLGLNAGDVVIAINSMPIERPEQAYAAFVSLKTAESLEISYLRRGREMHLSLPIVGEAPVQTAKAEAAAPVSKQKAEKAAKAESPAQAKESQKSKKK